MEKYNIGISNDKIKKTGFNLIYEEFSKERFLEMIYELIYHK